MPYWNFLGALRLFVCVAKAKDFDYTPLEYP